LILQNNLDYLMKLNQKKYIGFISAFISCFCIYLVYKKIDSDNFFKVLLSVNYIYIFLAGLFLYITIWLRALRWNLILVEKNNIRRLFKIQMIGYFVNYTLPLRAGEFLKSILLGKKNGMSKSYIFGTVIIERFLDMFSLFLMTLIALYISPIKTIANISIYWYLIIVVLSLCFFVFLFNFLKIVKINFFDNLIKNFVLAYDKFSLNQFVSSSLIGVVIWLIYWINVDMIFRAFNIEADYYQSLIVLIVSSFALSIPSLPGAIGTFHLAVKLTLSSIILIDNSMILPFITILHGYGYLLLTILGFYYVILDKDIGIKQLIEMEKVK
tara:strand:+ start:201 stop:1178 length:978 start_codon:yes stop_codon:yes gene_type:complete